MLEAVGVADTDELFRDVPRQLRYPRLDLPAPAAELEVLRELEALAGRDLVPGRAPCFLGAGAYRHFVPSVVDVVVSRSEFATAYTPYQPEISQGTLQAIFEYQTMIARLTGMDVSNASHYDGATAAAEAVLLALNVSQGARKRRRPRRRPAPPVPRGRAHLHPGHGPATWRGPVRSRGSRRRRSPRLCDDATACVVVQCPDFLGRIVAPGVMRASPRRCTPRRPARRGGQPRGARAARAARASWARTWWRGRGSRWAARSPSAARTSGSSPSGASTSAGRAAGSRARPSTGTAARLRLHPEHARAAHPAREGHLEHLHQPVAERARRGGPPGRLGPRGLRAVAGAVLAQGPLRRRPGIGSGGMVARLVHATVLPRVRGALSRRRRPRSTRPFAGGASSGGTTSGATTRGWPAACCSAARR